MLETIRSFFTPAHKKTVDDYILMDATTRNLIKDTEELLVRIADNAPSHNRNRTVRRRQKEWFIKVKVTQTFITVTMADTKYSTSPIKKRIFIKCYRRYMKSEGGVGVCKEARIHYLKDGKAHVRSVRESPLFQSIFYRIHHLDLAFSNERVDAVSSAKQALLNEERLLKTANLNDISLLIEESKRYTESVKRFLADATIEHQLQRIIDHVKKLQDDFMLLDFEERHVVRRMLREDIPSLLHTYLSLSPKHQLEHRENVYVTLSKMELTLIDYVEQLEQLRVDRMNHLLKLQSLRYGK